MPDKFIFWFDAFLLHYCLSYYFQKKYDADFYAIIDVTNNPKMFFETQNLVNLKKSWFFHDHINHKKSPDIKYLKEFNEKYDIDLWKLAINERLFYRFNNFYKFSDDEILSILEQECKLYENILDEIEPQFFLAERPPYHHNYLLFEICKRRNIQTIVLSQSRLAYKTILGNHNYKLDNENLYNSIKGLNRNFEELRNFRKSNDVSKQIKAFRNSFTTSKINKFQAAKQYLFSDNKNIQTHYTYLGRNKFSVLLHAMKSSIRKKSRWSFIENNLEKNISDDEPFIYFPLAMDEERNLLIGAPFYTNQIETIRHIAKSTPVGYKLYVKEHYNVSIRDWRPKSEYREILDIPNVRLFHPSVSNEDLLKKSSLVVTVAGTSGFEAAFYGKPSVILANTNYEILPSVHQVNSIEELPKILKNALHKTVNPNDLDRFLILLEQQSVDFDLYGFMTKMHDHFYFGGNLVNVEISTSKMQSFLEANKNSLENLVDAHIKKINEYKKNHH